MPELTNVCVEVPVETAERIRSGSLLEREFAITDVARRAVVALERVDPRDAPLSEMAASRLGGYLEDGE